MTARYQPDILLQRDEIVAPPIARACDYHSFGMPPAVYRAMAALLFGVMAVMFVGLSDPGLVVPMGINFIFLIAFLCLVSITARNRYIVASSSWRSRAAVQVAFWAATCSSSARAR